jgi:hypothetical protein
MPVGRQWIFSVYKLVLGCMNPVAGKSKTYLRVALFGAPSISVENFRMLFLLPSRAVNSSAAFTPCRAGWITNPPTNHFRLAPNC